MLSKLRLIFTKPVNIIYTMPPAGYRYGIGLLTFLFFISLSCLGQNSGQEDKVKGTIMQIHEEPTFQQRLKGDTVRVDTSQNSGTALPGKYARQYLPSQDSAYFRALRLKVPVSSRLQYRIDQIGINIDGNRQAPETPWDIANRNLSLPASYFVPRPVEVVMHQINIKNSFYVPFVQTYNPSSIQIPLEVIGGFLGLTEDVSPDIKYDIDFNADVTVVVYSTQATVVATIFSGKQIPGHYEFKWNFRDDNGRLMPSGDYISEIRIGNFKFIRKKITIP